LLDFFLLVAFAADFFRVTLLFASFRLTDDLPALVAFFLLGFFVLGFFLLADFFVTFFLLAFLPAFFEEVFFLLTAFLREGFLLELVFLLGVFFDLRATAALRELFFADFFFADFFETLFLAVAFFFGTRSTPRWLQTKPAIIQITRGRGSLLGAHFRPRESRQADRRRSFPGRRAMLGNGGRIDTAADVEFGRQAGEARGHTSDQVIEDGVGDCLVKSADVAI
jgi:hypothetical protein